MTDILAIIAIMFWAVVPLFWIPVHGFSGFFRKIGILTYVTPLITWLPFAYLVFTYRNFLLQYRIGMPLPVTIIGWIVLAFGIILQVWTLKLLSVWGLMGLPEVTHIVKGRIITEGPFSVIRHPTYFSHTLMFFGIFLLSGVLAVGAITLLDLIVVNFMVIPLEDRELINRFGDEYRQYRQRVPAFFPRLLSK